MKEKVLNLREFQRLLNKNGYKYKGANGSHMKYNNGKDTIVVNIKPNRMVLRRLIKEYNLI